MVGYHFSSSLPLVLPVLVFYNAYLPVIASEDRYDDVSAFGVLPAGYIGSVLLLMVNLLMIIKPEWFGLPEGSLAPRIFVMVGLVVVGFSQITFRRLPVDQPSDQIGQLLQHGFRQIRDVWKRLRHQKYIKRFLFAFFVIAPASKPFCTWPPHLPRRTAVWPQDLIIIILILQLFAIGGAHLFAFMSDRVGNKLALVPCCYYGFPSAFCLLCTGEGAVLCGGCCRWYGDGGIQSLSRSTYSKMIDDNEGDLNSYFSFTMYWKNCHCARDIQFRFCRTNDRRYAQ